MGYCDIREICFDKASNSNLLTSFCDRSIPNDLVCLGHFDMISITKLEVEEKKTPLDAIQAAIMKRQKAPNGYQYPLYILYESNAETELGDLREFWEFPSAFTSIARLHCEQAYAKPQTSFSEALVDRCNRRVSDNNKVIINETSQGKGYAELCVTPYSMPGKPFTVYIAIYDSLELGDVVAIIKGDSLAAVLEVQRHLYESPLVSDAYSYTGINSRMFSSLDGRFHFDWKSKVGDSVLQYASTRATVKNAQAAEEALTAFGLKDRIAVSFVVGTADMIIEWEKVQGRYCRNSIKEVDFLEYMRKSVFQEAIMHNAFFDMITRTGIGSVSPYNSRNEGGSRSNNQNNTLSTSVQELDSNHIWYYQLKSLLNTLKAMDGNSVIDALSKLVKSGVDAMTDRLNHLSDRGIDSRRNAAIDEDVLEFIESIVSLMNDLFHLECQLVQHPELTPIRYYVPAMVLRFIMNWVEKCAKTITEIELSGGTTENEEANYELFPLLIPRATENTSTRCLLDPWQDGQQYEGRKATLRVNVPINKLYEPWEILHILCHEMAHYCGNAIRNRTKRLDDIGYSTARYMVAMMDSVMGKYLGTSLLSTSETVFEFIAARTIQLYCHSCNYHNEYVENIRKYLPDAACRVFSSPEIQTQYIQSILSIKSKLNYLDWIRCAKKLRNYDTIDRCSVKIADHITNCLLPLYKECYADVIMILLMNCSFENYYRCVYKDELDRISKDSQRIETLELHYNRMALVCIAIGKIKGSAFPALTQDESVPEDVIKKICAYSKNPASWHNHSDCARLESWAFLFVEEAKRIVSYLEMCGTEFKKQMECNVYKDNVDQLRTVAGFVKAESFCWKKIRDYVEGT